MRDELPGLSLQTRTTGELSREEQLAVRLATMDAARYFRRRYRYWSATPWRRFLSNWVRTMWLWVFAPMGVFLLVPIYATNPYMMLGWTVVRAAARATFGQG